MADIELTPAQKRKINSAVKALNKVRADLQRENPEYYINWYLEDCGNLNLLEGDSHNIENGQSSQESAVIEVWDLEHSAGGGW